MRAITRLWHAIPSVSARFLLILIPVLALTTLGFSAAFFYAKHNELRSALVERIKRVAEIHAVALSSSLWAFDSTATQSVIKAIAASPDLTCVEVTDDLAGKRYSWPEEGCVAPEDGGRISRDVNIQNRRLGAITLTYTDDSVHAQIRTEILNTVWLLLLVAAGTVVTALLAHRLTIGVPLSRLMASIRLAERGQRERVVDWSSADELGRVIRAHNRLLERVEQDEAALRRTGERMTLAISATRSSVWDLDLRSGTYWWSPEFPRLLDYGPDELVMSARTWESLVHPEDLARAIDESYRHVRGEASTYSCVYRMRRKDGAWIWLEDRATAVRDAEGRAIRLTGTMSDVSDRVKAAGALARERNILQATLDNVDQGIVMVDGAMRLVLSNTRAAEMLNVSEGFLDSLPSYEEVVRRQRDAGEFPPGQDDPDLHSDRLYEGLSQPINFKRRRPDGSVIEIRSNPLPGGGFVRTFTDITVEARSAEEIFSAMQALEGAYAELKETQAHLVQAEKMASLALLVAGVAHEINTPVGIAYGCATHLTAKTRDLTAALESGSLRRSELAAYAGAANEAARLIQQNLGRASELVQSFKRVAVDQTSQERRVFDLGAYLGEVIASLAPRLRRSGHHLVVDCPPGIEVDGYPGALSQVVTNLLLNALTHAFEGRENGRMELTVREDGEELEIVFADDGRGIPQDDLARVFEPFFTTKRGAGGSGLGLHIVYNLVTQTLGGRVAIDSATGIGTSITVRIPRSPAARVVNTAATIDT